jgi:hypothetical protein
MLHNNIGSIKCNSQMQISWEEQNVESTIANFPNCKDAEARGSSSSEPSLFCSNRFAVNDTMRAGLEQFYALHFEQDRGSVC